MIQTTNLYIELFGLILLILLAVSFNSFKKLFTFSTEEEPKRGERSQVLDFIRGIAMCAIIIIHIDSYFGFFHPEDPKIVISKILANLARFCVPAFILSSGFFLSWKGAGSFWKSKIKNVAFPYIIIACLGFFTKYPPENFVSDIVPKILLGKVFQPYYYVPLLFGFYLLYAVFFRHLQKWKSRIFYSVLFGSLAINFWSNHFFPKNQPAILGFEAISMTNFIFFFTVGFSAKRILTNKELFLTSLKENKFYFPSLLLAIILYLSLVTYYTVTMRLEISNHFIFYPIACFVVLTFLGIKFESIKQIQFQKVYTGIAYIGENSLAIFLLHPLVIHLMHTIDPYTFGGFYLGWILTFAINIILPLMLWRFGYGIIYKLAERFV